MKAVSFENVRVNWKSGAYGLLQIRARDVVEKNGSKVAKW